MVWIKKDVFLFGEKWTLATCTQHARKERSTARWAVLGGVVVN